MKIYSALYNFKKEGKTIFHIALNITEAVKKIIVGASLCVFVKDALEKFAGTPRFLLVVLPVLSVDAD